VDEAIQKRITRQIAIIVGAFALGLMAMYGLIATLEKRNEDMRLHRVEVREFFRLVTLFQGDFDRLIRTSGAVGTESPLLDPDSFSTAQTAARGHLAELRRLNVDKIGLSLETLSAAFEDYAGAVRMALVESKSLGLGDAVGLGNGMGAARERMENAALSSGDRAVFAKFPALNRGQFKFLRDRIFNDPSEAVRDEVGDREGLLKAVADLAATGRASAMTPKDKLEFAAAADAYGVAVERVFSSTRRRAAALTAVSLSQAAVIKTVVDFRQALFAENDVVYAKEEEYRAVSRTTIGVAVLLLSLGFVFLIVVMGGRLRREAFLEQDRSKIFKDFALSSRSVSWETDASCRYTRRETSGALDDSVPGYIGLPMVEAEASSRIEFEGPTAFTLVGDRMPYRDILFAHTDEYGVKTWWRSSGTPYYDVDGKFLGYRGISLDVTETKNYERAVAETVARSRDFAAASSDERWEIDGEGVIRSLESQGPTADEMRRIALGRRFSELVAMADAQTEAGESLDRYMELRQPFRDLVFHGRDLMRSGGREWFRMSGVPFFDPRTGGMGMRCVNARITKTRVLELENRERQRQLEALVSDLPVIVQRMRARGPDGIEVIYVSPGIETILGIPADSLLGSQPQLRYGDNIHPEDREGPLAAVRAAFEFGTDYDITYRARTSTGVYRILQSRGRVMKDSSGNRFIESIALDVTEAEERRERELELQTRLVEAQKMEAMGRLAGGIAHDFNNILGATRSFGDLLADGLPEGTRLHGYAVRIVAACDRAAEMVRQILTFTRAKDAPREVVSVAEAIHEVEALLGERMPPQISLTVSNREPQAVLVVNPSHLTQVLLNLAVNAMDALDDKAGRIDIGVAEVAVGAEAPFALGLQTDGADDTRMFYANGSLAPGHKYLRISVCDTGPGIPQSIAAKIFDPFFTTKDKRKGSGLGLSVITGIVKAQGGAITVESRLGRGTTFSVYFPAVRSQSLVERLVATESRIIGKDHIRGKERILIVDDEIDVADSLSYALTNLGYETAPVYAPIEALEIIEENPEAWDVLISDQSMPGLKGLDLIRKVRFIRPGIRTILCTGYSDSTTEAATTGDGVDAFFTKPVPADVVAASIRSFFDSKKASRGPNAA
jgi:signal transduction histidine kinase/ActR/RegA family two-component response regulator